MSDVKIALKEGMTLALARASRLGTFDVCGVTAETLYSAFEAMGTDLAQFALRFGWRDGPTRTMLGESLVAAVFEPPCGEFNHRRDWSKYLPVPPADAVARVA